jgi:hypothetical protein
MWEPQISYSRRLFNPIHVFTTGLVYVFPRLITLSTRIYIRNTVWISCLPVRVTCLAHLNFLTVLSKLRSSSLSNSPVTSFVSAPNTSEWRNKRSCSHNNTILINNIYVSLIILREMKLEKVVYTLIRARHITLFKWLPCYRFRAAFLTLGEASEQ